MNATKKHWVNGKVYDCPPDDGCTIPFYTDESGNEVIPLRVYDMSEALAATMLRHNEIVYIMEDLQKGFCLTQVLHTDMFNHGQCAWHGNCLEIPVLPCLPHNLILAQLGKDLYIRNVSG